jgi:hypothetical protein
MFDKSLHSTKKISSKEQDNLVLIEVELEMLFELTGSHL